MKKVLLFCLVILFVKVHSQQVNWEKLDDLDPDLILQEDFDPIPVLLLGTFHFDYPGLDGHKTKDSDKVNILSDQKQKELNELINILITYKPTKIYIESFKQNLHDSLYSAYIQNSFTLGKNEIYQIAYRLGKKLGHKKVYAVDDSSFLSELSNENSDCINSIYSTKYELINERNDIYWHNAYSKMHSLSDELTKDLTLLERFLIMSEPDVLKRMNGHYLSSGFSTIDNQGPDRLAMWWYSRNLRILNNILKTNPNSDDKILVLFGNGHMPILNHLFESMPQFEIKRLKNLTSPME